MKRSIMYEKVLSQIEDNIRFMAKNEKEFDSEERIKLGDIADQIAQIRIPIKVNIQENNDHI